MAMSFYDWILLRIWKSRLIDLVFIEKCCSCICRC